MNVTQLRCSSCDASYAPGRLYNLCVCGKPLLVEYDLKAAATKMQKRDLPGRPKSLWRYLEVLPVEDVANIVSLGEGFTPLLQARRLGASMGVDRLYIKDESVNPTGSFKARGMAVAVSMALETGVQALAVPSAGNAGGALAAYAAAAGIEAHVFMPRDVPKANRVETIEYGARVQLIDGLITDCARAVRLGVETKGWFDVSTLKEPYRVEGKKTMGYELAEQFDFQLPDAILYPTGGGTGLIGMWKAFDEMEQMGWIDSRRPRMFSVQASGCAPIVRAFERHSVEAEEFPNARTIAAGLRVPRAIGDFLMLRILRESGGGAAAVSDAEILAAVKELASAEGVFAAPEGAACLPALRRLLDRGSIRPTDSVVMFNTGSGFKYLELFE